MLYLYLEGGDNRHRASLSPTFVSGVGGEEPDGAQPAASQVHYGGGVPEPLPRRPEVLPHTAHLRRRRGGGGVEVRGAEAAVWRGGDAEPKVAPRDVLRLAAERERPVAFLAPGAARRVEGVGANAIHVRPDGCAGDGVGEDLGAAVPGVLHVRRLREVVPVPIVAVRHVVEGLEAAAPLARDVVEDVQVVAVAVAGGDRRGDGVVLLGAHRGPGAVGGVADEGPAQLVDGHDPVAAEEVEVQGGGSVGYPARVRGNLEAHGGRRKGHAHVHGLRLRLRLRLEQGFHVHRVQRVGPVPVVGETQVDMPPLRRRRRHA